MRIAAKDSPTYIAVGIAAACTDVQQCSGRQPLQFADGSGVLFSPCGWHDVRTSSAIHHVAFFLDTFKSAMHV